MSKRVCGRYSTVELGGHDVSHWCSRWAVIGKVNELYVAEIDIVMSEDSPLVIKDVVHATSPEYKRHGGAISATIEVNGTDIAPWVSGWETIVKVGHVDMVRLYVQADREVLRINGMYPWEEKEDE